MGAVLRSARLGFRGLGFRGLSRYPGSIGVSNKDHGHPRDTWDCKEAREVPRGFLKALGRAISSERIEALCLAIYGVC